MYWVILGVKFLIYCILSDVSIGDLEWVPFLTTRYQNESNIDEAKFFLNNHQNPYLTDQIFQKPLVVYFLAYLKDFKYLYQAFFFLVDCIVGHLITQFATPQQSTYKRSIQIFYHLNPITFFTLLVKNTDYFEILSTLLSVYLVMRAQTTKNMIASAFVFAFSIYCNPNHLIFIGTVFIILKKYNPQSVLPRMLAFTLLTFAFVCLFLGLSEYLVGWTFIEKCYYDAYFPTNHFPTLGFIWALFSGLFTRYKLFYHALFAMFPLCFVMPFYSLFVKYGITRKDLPLSFIGLSLGFYYFTTILYYHYVTAYNLCLATMLLFQGSQYIFRVQIGFLSLWVALFISVMAFGLQITWTHSLTGNPSFLFFECFVFYACSVITVTETAREFVKKSKEDQLIQQ